MQNDNFYKDKFFEEWDRRMSSLEKDISTTRTAVENIQYKLNYIYGLVAGVTLVLNVLWFWVKEKIFHM